MISSHYDESDDSKLINGKSNYDNEINDLKEQIERYKQRINELELENILFDIKLN